MELFHCCFACPAFGVVLEVVNIFGWDAEDDAEHARTAQQPQHPQRQQDHLDHEHSGVERRQLHQVGDDPSGVTGEFGHGLADRVQPLADHRRTAADRTQHATTLGQTQLADVVEEYCVRCHSDRRLRGNLSLESFDADDPAAMGEIAEKMVVKLRAGMMPPPGERVPTESEYEAFIASLEAQLDGAVAGEDAVGGQPLGVESPALDVGAAGEQGAVAPEGGQVLVDQTVEMINSMWSASE